MHTLEFQSNATIEVSGFARGVYMVQFHCNNSVENCRVLVE